MLNNDNEITKLLALLNSILNGVVGIIDGCRKVVEIQYRLNMYDNKNFAVFESIDSDTDHFPIGDVRQYWNKESLAKADIEMKAYEEDVKNEVREACEKLISELSNTN